MRRLSGPWASHPGPRLTRGADLVPGRGGARGRLLVPVLVALAGAGTAAAMEKAKVSEAIAKAANWEYGDDAGPLEYVHSVVIKMSADPATARELESLIVKAMGAAGAKPGKAFLCRQLMIVGTKDSVPVLAPLLTDGELSHMARYALEGIAGEEVDHALRRALGAADDHVKVGIIASLGRRGSTVAVDEVVREIDRGDADVKKAALDALGRMDSDKAARAVLAARRRVTGKLKSAADNACLNVAARLARQGRTARAAAIYEELCGRGESSMCRIGALQGLVACRGGEAVALAIAALGEADAKLRAAAVPMLRSATGPDATRAIAAELARRPPAVQIMLVMVLAHRGDRAALSDVAALIKSPEAGVRLAAIEALGVLGDASAVTTLARLAAKATGEEQQVARASLDGLRADGANAAIARELSSADAGIRLECVRSLGVRGAASPEAAADCIDAVLAAGEDEDAGVALAAMKSLRALAGAEHVPALVALLVKTTDTDARREAERAVVAAAKKIPADESPARAVLEALRRRPAGQARVSLITVLGKIGDRSSLNALYSAARDADAGVRLEAVRSLAAWPTADPSGALKRLARDAALAENVRILALRGFIAQVALSGDATDEDALVMYAEAMRIARRTDEKKLVLFELSEMRHEGALAMAKEYLTDPALKRAAADAVKKIEKALKAPALVTASLNSGSAKLALDGDPGTRWDTGTAMRGGEWFLMDLGRSKTVRKIVLDTKGSRGDYPRGYEVWISKNSRGKGLLAASGKGAVVTEIKLDPPVVGRFVRIVQTGSTGGLFWSIHELTVDTE